MCVARCSRFVGVSLVPLAVLCILGNILLLLPDLQTRYLLEGHVTREATWGSGLWASGFLVLLAARSFISGSFMKGCCGFRMEMLWLVGYSCIAMVAAGICFVTSSTGLVNGPLCLHNSTEGPVWDEPPQWQRGRFLYEQVSWPSVCQEPRGVVLWNVVLFSILMAASAIQVLLCIVHTLNAILGMLCGNSFGRNKVRVCVCAFVRVCAFILVEGEPSVTQEMKEKDYEIGQNTAHAHARHTPVIKDVPPSSAGSLHRNWANDTQ
ncbi:transmembrane 4 L6 family member 5 [Scleropages formosus]|uniref:transmembrane 4 L6 family member 5 n=1 Tax=Scleropages formosus TaxID=113540 RepID=UPI00087895A2|nr:transmembrane 4 L6 family member 5-like [Scleropages formosus]